MQCMSSIYNLNRDGSQYRFLYCFVFHIIIISEIIYQGTFRTAMWRGIQVAVKKLGEDVFTDEDTVWVGYAVLLVFVLLLFVWLCYISFSVSDHNPLTYDPHWIYRRAFRDELALLQKIRHPNVVQFLGAVTQSSPMMIVTEYLPKVYMDSIWHIFWMIYWKFYQSITVQSCFSNIRWVGSVLIEFCLDIHLSPSFTVFVIITTKAWPHHLSLSLLILLSLFMG